MIEHARNWMTIVSDKKGVTALEYAIIAGVLGIGLVAIFGTFKTSLGTLFTSVATAM